MDNFRSIPAISKFDWYFTSNQCSSKSFATLTCSVYIELSLSLFYLTLTSSFGFRSINCNFLYSHSVFTLLQVNYWLTPYAKGNIFDFSSNIFCALCFMFSFTAIFASFQLSLSVLFHYRLPILLSALSNLWTFFTSFI